NGNVTEEGIKLDLDWMHRIGLGGVTIIQADSPTPQVVPNRLISTSPEWKQAFTYALKTAKDLGLEVAPSGSPAVDETAIPSIPTASDDAQTRSSEDKPALGPDTPAA